MALLLAVTGSFASSSLGPRPALRGCSGHAESCGRFPEQTLHSSQAGARAVIKCTIDQERTFWLEASNGELGRQEKERNAHKVSQRNPCVTQRGDFLRNSYGRADLAVRSALVNPASVAATLPQIEAASITGHTIRAGEEP